MLPSWLKLNPIKAPIVTSSGGKYFLFHWQCTKLLNQIRVHVQSVSKYPSAMWEALLNDYIFHITALTM